MRHIWFTAARPPGGGPSGRTRVPRSASGRRRGVRWSVLRTALRPRWLALLVLVLVAASVMARLGEWQLSRAREQGAAAQQTQVERPPVALTDLLRARQTFVAGAADRRITTSGSWDPARQVLVGGRVLDGVDGVWVLTALRLSDGSAVAVLRGWAASDVDPAVSAARLPAGTVAVEGVLRPGEPAAARRPGEVSGLPAGQLDRVATTELVQRWPYPLLNGYVLLTDARPAGLAPLPRPVPVRSSPDAGLDWRNVSYALQWWLFAGFGLFMWWRIVRDDHRGVGRTVEPHAHPEPVPDPEPDRGLPVPSRGEP